jgi:hypothetical protein
MAMNERIEKLAVEARQYAFGEVENSQDPTEWSTKYYNEMFEQKFAELIVRECIEQGDTLAKHYIDTHPEQEQVMLLASIADYSKEIKKHFGVEE